MKMNFGGRQLQVLVVYDNFTAGQRAMALLKRVDGKSGGVERLTHVMLRFDLMSDPVFFELAVQEAITSDIVVVATSEGRTLPQILRDWATRWLLRKGSRPLALVATLDYHVLGTKEAGCVSPYLAQLARQGNMQFFSNGRDPGKEPDLVNFKVTDHAFESAFVRSHPLAQN